MVLLCSLFALPARKLRAVNEYSGMVSPHSISIISRCGKDMKMGKTVQNLEQVTIILNLSEFLHLKGKIIIHAFSTSKGCCGQKR